MMLIAPYFPRIYNTTNKVRSLATHFIMVSSLCMPIYAFMHACYFTLRSGGKTVITFLFDSVFVWAVDIPLAYVLTYYTSMPIIMIYFCCQFIETIKCVIGYILVKKGVWIHNMAKN